MSDEITYLSQTVDYLGFLEAKLRDLRGIETLAYELIQNADDVHDEFGRPAATRILFDVRDDALIVENDGVFRQTDFDRIRKIAGGGKREEEGTTGAFGIGFISVYQVTDQPEIFSSGQHWTIRPDEREDRRIAVRNLPTDATRFRLAWAFDPTTEVRRKLRVEALKVADLDAYAQSMATAITRAALFLKQLQMLEVRRNGHVIKCISRHTNGNGTLVLEDGLERQTWRLLKGNFAEDAQILKLRFRQIEAKRHSKVIIAIPHGSTKSGRLYAVLPTQTTIPLPFHINADFFPSSDRKRILFENGYQADWNRAAIRSAANALAQNLDALRTEMAPRDFWGLLQSLEMARRVAGTDGYDPVFGGFWAQVEPGLRTRRVVFTSSGNWVTPPEAALLRSDAEQDATTIFQALKIEVVHPDLRPYYNLAQQVGTPLLNVSRLVDALQVAGLDQASELAQAPEALHKRETWPPFWAAIEEIANRETGESKRQLGRTLGACAIAFDSRGKLCPPREMRHGDPDTRALFELSHWPADDHAPDTMPGKLIAPFTVESAIHYLMQLTQTDPPSDGRRLPSPATLYTWFEARKDQIHANPDLKQRLRDLPIWPAGGGRRPLTHLYIPGDFEDPLGLALLVDLSALGGRKDFLRDLDVEELTFWHYVKEQVPGIFAQQPDLPTAARRKLVQVLAQKLGEIREDQWLKDALSRIPIIECQDSRFRPAREVYMASDVTSFLSGRIHVAAFMEEKAEAVKALYQWLSVSEEPRAADVLQLLRELPPQPDERSRKVVQSVVEYLIGQWPKWNDAQKKPYEALRSLTWLPGKVTPPQWYRPAHLYAEFNKNVFESQAVFVDLPYAVQSQTASVNLLAFLGLNRAPTISLVVRHLLACSGRNVEVPKEVYTWLSQYVAQAQADETVLEPLKKAACLCLPGRGYFRPDQVFWQDHPFGRFRYRLGDELRQFSALFAKLGVRERPEERDYWTVLGEISTEYGDHNRELDTEANGVVMRCWEALDRSLQNGMATAEELSALSSKKVIPDPRTRPMLNEPRYLYFEDRAGFAARFKGFLDNSVITKSVGAWQAMEAAGVQMLSQAVETHLLEPANAVIDESLSAHLTNRRLAIRRVIEAARTVDPAGLDTSALERLQYQRAERLLVKFTVRAFRQEVDSDPEEVPALLLSKEDLLLVVCRDGKFPWAAIARELSYAIKRDGEIGPLAGGIKEALEHATLQEAMSSLDDLAYPPLQEIEAFETEANTIDVVGAASNIPFDPVTAILDGNPERSPMPEEPDEAAPGAVAAGTGKGAGGSGGSTSTFTTGQGTATGATGATARGSSGSQGSSGTEGGQAADTGKTAPGAAPKSAVRPRPRGRLRTYVLSSDAADKDEANTARAKQNAEVDRAGVALVLEYEKRAGRTPAEQEHGNEGYDIESVDAQGHLRYIEVKSLSGYWNPGDPAGLSDTQFKWACDKGDAFWLYVVERATSPDHQIYRIQDPGILVSQFLYDDGWKALAQGDEGGSGQSG